MLANFQAFRKQLLLSQLKAKSLTNLDCMWNACNVFLIVYSWSEYKPAELIVVTEHLVGRVIDVSRVLLDILHYLNFSSRIAKDLGFFSWCLLLDNASLLHGTADRH